MHPLCSVYPAASQIITYLTYSAFPPINRPPSIKKQLQQRKHKSAAKKISTRDFSKFLPSTHATPETHTHTTHTLSHITYSPPHATALTLPPILPIPISCASETSRRAPFPLCSTTSRRPELGIHSFNLAFKQRNIDPTDPFSDHSLTHFF